MKNNKNICISVISHNQATLVSHLLDALTEYCAEQIHTVILTVNIPEEKPINFSVYADSIKLQFIYNQQPKGFAENHNQAFAICQSQHPSAYFCVLNPDITFTHNPFPALMQRLDKSPKIGVIAPVIFNKNAELQDSARKFLNFSELIKRIFLRYFCPVKPTKNNFISSPDWVAGMFMLFKKNIYAKIKGFDAKYFLYCEDMDLCARLKKQGYTVVIEPQASAVHDAQRNSHKNIIYFFWHLKSLLRFLYRYYFCYK